MDWASFHREVAERGWTFSQRAAHFIVGISGTIVSVAPFDPEQEPPGIEETVRVDDFRDASRDAILEAAIRCAQGHDPEFG